jgi:hypothetical protein
MRPGFTPLSGLIAEGLRHYHLDKGVKAAQAVDVWDKVAGPSVAAVTRADLVRDGVLWVFTKSSAWSQELSMLREQLVRGINSELGTPALTDIRFQVKRFAKSPPAQVPVKSVRTLSASDRNTVAKLAERLDGDLLDRISGVALKHFARGDRLSVCPGCGGPMDAGYASCPFCR